MPSKKDILDKAIEAVADRGLNYGSPEDNFGRIAALWNAHVYNRYGTNADTLRLDMSHFDAHDVVMMMVLMKVARLENAAGHSDSWIDIAGYAACGGSMDV